jgi:hypothetical protein
VSWELEVKINVLKKKHPESTKELDEILDPNAQVGLDRYDDSAADQREYQND